MRIDPLVSVQRVSVEFAGGLRALDDATLTIGRDDIVGLVGESGSGKTTLCRVLMGLTPAASGRVTFEGKPLDVLLAADALAFRRRAQMLLQDAHASLSPRMTIRKMLIEPFRIHGLSLEESWPRVLSILQRLGLSEDVLAKYPHQISGGQARRVGVARALVLRPELIVADEPTAGLDLSVQGGLLNLLLDLREEFGLTYLIVSHNLNVVRRITRRVVVMYLGQIVEEAETGALFQRAANPYTMALLSTNPAIDPAKRRKRIVLQGEIPSAVNPPRGCRFHTRCPVVQARCKTEEPKLVEIAPGRRVRCHFPFSADTLA
ncbi:MAG: ABC transporter ATP-binding protein [Proteobacteria bacterium]|nr:ABC transporter ATP-binding protein [Pseudomonadota bacterium]